ncbi:A disintegrin and metalloproteinase with thrombospondin motifs 18 [Zootermopsis nevadensis]|uniref:A disintegrin and metalloproteinase with thrombospondin motifs 18 n=2 Tax=Zootermopsis nevadensis TaxID=136037 RepID=A0A067RCW6_ZOONE|nr:A disintegrin and metalloproteinase with thrombospondin motifs 18 [Zootermopsis nevadensis]
MLSSKLDVSEEESTKTSRTFNGDDNEITDSSSTGNRTKFGDVRGNTVQGVKPCHICSEEIKVVQRRGKRSVVLVPGMPIHVETAVFVDKDLYQHMALNFPADTERELVRVVLAMINAVQLLYHDPSLGRQVNFVLKRLEILHADPASLQRPHDIDRFLSSFCTWQRGENPPGDSDPLHWDHALILTGLDLYVVSKNGKVSSQVVGLAPVAGMCTATSSCTVNEGRHFESVYVVAHEIGHNLGMRHDGPLAENECDPGSYIMSPTLGSGKITWSSCSRRYLQMFLETPQSQCLLDHSSSGGQLDHSAEGALPGERFNADQQCMLKYGRGSIHATQQPLDDVCRDLHCQRDRYTWTSHPALEGTFCGNNKWCRSGRCVGKGLSALQAGFSLNQRVDGAWSEWSPFSECASGCLYSDEGRLHAGSTGIMVSTRRCNNPRPENGGLPCRGSDRRYRTCFAEQCGNVQKTTIRDFADQICIRAREVDTELLGTGVQRISSDLEEACTVWCYKRSGGSKSRGWTFPDGTTCQSHQSRYGKSMYCISGRCEEFVCDQYDVATFSTLPELCPGPSRGEGDLQVYDSSFFAHSKGQRREVPKAHTLWSPASGCHFNCLAPGRGLRLVIAKDTKCHLEDNCEGGSITSIQLCEPDKLGCGRLKTPFEHATTVCRKYRERVRRLSGLGMQISPVAQDPDRPCRVACQDDEVNHRFYLVNGEDGWFPFGTDCSRGVLEKRAYCVSGKCLDFGSDDTPLHESEYTLPLIGRLKRSLMNNSTTKVKTTVDQAVLDRIISSLNFTDNSYQEFNSHNNQFSIDLSNPIHIEVITGMKGLQQSSVGQG